MSNALSKLLHARNTINDMQIKNEFKAWLLTHLEEGTAYYYDTIEPTTLKGYEPIDWLRIEYVYRTSKKEVQNE